MWIVPPSVCSAVPGERQGRRWIGIEQNPDYAEMIADRTAQKPLPFAENRDD